MSLLRGQPAMEAARRIMQSADLFVCVEVDPEALKVSDHVICVGHSEDTALIDARQTPGLAKNLPAKTSGCPRRQSHHRALVRTFQQARGLGLLHALRTADLWWAPHASGIKCSRRTLPRQDTSEASEGFGAIRQRTQGVANLLKKQTERINQENCAWCPRLRPKRLLQLPKWKKSACHWISPAGGN